MFPLGIKTVSLFVIIISLFVCFQQFVGPVYADVASVIQAESEGPDDNLKYLFAVFFLTWLVFFGYIFFLSRRLIGLKSELEYLKLEMNNRDSEQPKIE